MIPVEIIGLAEQTISRLTAREQKILNKDAVGGGCINFSFCVKAGDKKYFLKWNDANKFPGMFSAEAKGLQLLQRAGALKIPEVYCAETTGTFSLILMEWIEQGKRMKSFWSDYGKNLALLHRNSQELFGLDHDNYIGSLAQRNDQQASWIDFFMRERLEPQLKHAIGAGNLDTSIMGAVAKLERRLDEIIPVEKPSLLHGDLWNGNFLVDIEGSACLIDPAVYYGHREMDLAMTRLFGGFAADFYEGYNNEFPLEKGFESRVDIYNLYPLLVHVNLFGGGYIQQVKSILSRF